MLIYVDEGSAIILKSVLKKYYRVGSIQKVITQIEEGLKNYVQ